MNDMPAQGFDATTALMWIGVVAGATVVGLFAPRLWVRKIAVVLVTGVALCMYLMLLEDIRAHVSEARSLGRSPGFIDGMLVREGYLGPIRAVTFFCASGLALLAFTSQEKRKP